MNKWIGNSDMNFQGKTFL